MQIKGLYQKRGWWYYQPPTVNGQRPRPIALKTKDELRAVDEAYKHYKKGALGAQSKDAMAFLLERYLEEMRATNQHTAKTSHTTRLTLTKLSKNWGNPKVTWITRERVMAWWEELKERKGLAAEKMSEASITSYLLRLRGFLTWLVENKHIRGHPMEQITLGRVKKTRREKFCTVTEREVLLADPPTEELAFILYFGFFAGLRFGEMLAMEPEWLTKSKNGYVLTVQKTAHWVPKDKEARTLIVHPRLEKFIDDYGLRRPFMLKPAKKWKDAPAYRFNPKKSFKAFVVKHKMKWVTYHTLRHSFATHMAMAGAPMIEIADALGDGLKVVEETYVAYSPSGKSTILAI